MEAAIPLCLSFPSSPSFFFCICVLNLWSSPSSVYKSTVGYFNTRLSQTTLHDHYHTFSQFVESDG